MAMKKDRAKKVLVLDTKTSGYNWLFSRYGVVDNAHYTEKRRFMADDLRKYRFIVFTGGSDVDPALYGETPHEQTVCNKERDTYEVALAKKATRAGVPLVGICRGAQLGTVVSGATLEQHTPGHTGGMSNRHTAYIDVGYSPYAYFDVSSDHHQIMQAWDRPDGSATPVNYTCLARAHDQSQEIIWYKDTSWLCVQYHPEWHSPSDVAVQVFQACVNAYVLETDTEALEGIASRIKGLKGVPTTYSPPAANVENIQQLPPPKYKSPLTLLGSKNNE